MLKRHRDVNQLERHAAEQVRLLLQDVPFVVVEGIEFGSEPPREEGRGAFLLQLKSHGRRHQLACEVKGSGQPRHVRAAAAQLRYRFDLGRRDISGVVIAPYLSPAAQSICREQEIGFVDLEGNCRLVFNGVFIERSVPAKPSTARRELKSIFAPKSAQVLRLLMRDPGRAWRVAELAEVAGVSLGHASNVRAALVDREWAAVGPGGLSLTNPDALLDSWREAYERPAGTRSAFYTTLHGAALQEAVRVALGAASEHGAAMLASFSAAQWLAPFARTGSQYFYADEEGSHALRNILRLLPAAKGENIVVVRLDDDGLFRDMVEPAPGIRCTSPVQTYLDLAAAGERGREAAEHLRTERLNWSLSCRTNRNLQPTMTTVPPKQ